MQNSWTKLVAAAALVVLAPGFAGCGGSGPGGPGAGSPSSAAAAGDAISSALQHYGLAGAGAQQVIDRLDQLPVDERPHDLTASVHPGQLRLSVAGAKTDLPLPKDRFYLAVAPYETQTHDCFYHSLTTCTGELPARSMRVRVVDRTHHRVLVSGTRTTYDNGFVGFWLPRDIKGAVQVRFHGKAGEVAFGTGAKAPTCLTGLRLT